MAPTGTTARGRLQDQSLSVVIESHSRSPPRANSQPVTAVEEASAANRSRPTTPRHRAGHRVSTTQSPQAPNAEAMLDAALRTHAGRRDTATGRRHSPTGLTRAMDTDLENDTPMPALPTFSSSTARSRLIAEVDEDRAVRPKLASPPLPRDSDQAMLEQLRKNIKTSRIPIP